MCTRMGRSDGQQDKNRKRCVFCNRSCHHAGTPLLTKHVDGCVLSSLRAQTSQSDRSAQSRSGRVCIRYYKIEKCDQCGPHTPHCTLSQSPGSLAKSFNQPFRLLEADYVSLITPHLFFLYIDCAPRTAIYLRNIVRTFSVVVLLYHSQYCLFLVL
jgi:hypothetical protein